MSERYRGSVRSRLVRAMPRFIAIGGVGFVADGGLLTLLASGLGFDVYLSRLASFAFASFLTWWLNRVWTFSSTDVRRTREYVRYIAIQIVGAKSESRNRLLLRDRRIQPRCMGPRFREDDEMCERRSRRWGRSLGRQRLVATISQSPAWRCGARSSLVRQPA